MRSSYLDVRLVITPRHLLAAASFGLIAVAGPLVGRAAAASLDETVVRTVTDDDVQRAIDGLTQFAANHPDLVDGFGDAILESCPVGSTEVLAGLLGGEAEVSDLAVLVRDESQTVADATFENLMCTMTAVPEAGLPAASVSISVSVLADEAIVADYLETRAERYDDVEFPEFGTLGSCVDFSPPDSPRPNRVCQQLWVSGRLLVGVTHSTTDAWPTAADADVLGEQLASMLPGLIGELAELDHAS